MAVRHLFSQKNGNAESCAVEDEALDGVGSPGSQARVETVLQCLFRPGIGPEGCPERTAALLPQERAAPVGENHAIGRNLLIDGPAERTKQLADFLLQGHLFQQGIRPPSGIQRGIRPIVLSAAGRKQQEEKNNKKNV